MVPKVEQLLEQGLWDKAWRVAQQDLRRSTGDESSKFLNEEIPLKVRAKVPWWIDPKQRKRLLHFVRIHELLQAKRERLSTKGNVRPLELLFDAFSRNLQEFCSQVGKCAESVWAQINDRAKACSSQCVGTDYSRWPTSIGAFRRITSLLCDGVYGVVTDPSLLAGDTFAREVATAYLQAILELYDTDDPYKGPSRLRVLSGEEPPDRKLPCSTLSDKTVDLLSDILQRIRGGRVFNRVACPIDDEGRVHNPDYLANLPKIGYTPLVQKDAFIDLVDNQQSYLTAQLVQSADSCPPAIVLHLNAGEGWKLATGHVGEDIPEGEETRLRVLLFDGEQPVVKTDPYNELMKGSRLRLDGDGRALLGKALREDRARVVITHILADADKFQEILLAAAERLDISREIGDAALAEISKKVLRKVFSLDEVVPALAELKKVEATIARAHRYEEVGNLKQALRVIRSVLKNFRDNPLLLKEEKRVSRRVERDGLIARARGLAAKGRLADKEKALAELAAFYCEKGTPISRDVLRRVCGDDKEALHTWCTLAASIEKLKRSITRRKVEHIHRRLKNLETKISSSEMQNDIQELGEKLGEIEKEIALLTPLSETNTLWKLFKQVSERQRTKSQTDDEIAARPTMTGSCVQSETVQPGADSAVASKNAPADVKVEGAETPSVIGHQAHREDVSQIEGKVRPTMEDCREISAESAAKTSEEMAEEEALRYLAWLEQHVDEKGSVPELRRVLGELDRMPNDICDVWKRLSSEQKIQIADMQDTIRDEIHSLLAKKERSQSNEIQRKGTEEAKNKELEPGQPTRTTASNKHISALLIEFPKAYRKLNVAMRNLVGTIVAGDSVREIEARREVAAILARMHDIDPYDLRKYQNILQNAHKLSAKPHGRDTSGSLDV